MCGRITTVAVLAAMFVHYVGNAAYASNPLLAWDQSALQGIRDSKLGAPMAARALAIVHTCMYDAWAAYDERAAGTQLGGALRRPLAEHTLANKEQAVSYAAYRALVDVLPVDTVSSYAPLMQQLGYDPLNTSADIETPAGVGNVACAAVLEFRHHDNANQLGDQAQGAYSDWSAYSPRNKPSILPIRQDAAVDPNHWQPLVYVNSTGDLVGQRFLAAQWCFVTPFALIKGDELRGALKPFEPATYGSPEYRTQAEELVNLSAGLTDEQKAIAEYWLDGPNSEQPPGHWMRFAQWVSERDHHSLDDDVKMFFLLSNALFDGSIAAWDAKRTYDSVRPVTAISVLFKGQQIQSWGGPGKRAITMDAAVGTNALSTNDSPSIPLFSNETEAKTLSFSATMYMLWLPSVQGVTTVPVPLDKVTWQWTGDAAFAGSKWSVKSGGGSAGSVSPTSALPTWNSSVVITTGPACK